MMRWRWRIRLRRRRYPSTSLAEHLVQIRAEHPPDREPVSHMSLMRAVRDRRLAMDESPARHAPGWLLEPRGS